MGERRSEIIPLARPPIWGIMLPDNRQWMILGAEDGAGCINMPHCFFRKQDAIYWLADYGADFRGALVMPLNDEAQRGEDWTGE